MVIVAFSKAFLLITIDDDGIGFKGADPQIIFNSFYTTKEKHGTGLGLSITRSIIEGHGGHINVSCKEQLPNGNMSLAFFITFPLYTEKQNLAESPKDAMVLFKKNLDMLPQIIRIFQNVSINPHVLTDSTEFNPQHFSQQKFIIFGNPVTIAEINRDHPGYTCYTLINHNSLGLYVVGNKKNNYNGIFSEEFLLSTFN